MEWLSYSQVNIYAMLVLMAIYVTSRKGKTDRFLTEQRLFEHMLVTNFLLLLMDTIHAAIDGGTFPHAREVLYLVSVCGSSLCPVLSLFYAAYCDVKLGVSDKRVRRNFLIYSTVPFVNFILTLLSVRYSLFFSYGDSNTFQREKLYWLSVVLSYLMLFAAFFRTATVLQRGKNDSKSKSLYPLLFFPIPPILGGILQLLLPKLAVVWVYASLSVLIIFINIRNVQITTDSLTGLYNRRQLQPYLDWKTKKIRPEMGLYLFMLDLDGFKKNNDTFGHLTGDAALIRAAECIRSTCTKNDFLIRYGGDEFMVLTEQSDDAAAQEKLDQICGAAKKFCEGEPFSLVFSGGFSRWQEGDTVIRFISDADKKMYENK